MSFAFSFSFAFWTAFSISHASWICNSEDRVESSRCSNLSHFSSRVQVGKVGLLDHLVGVSHFFGAFFFVIIPFFVVELVVVGAIICLFIFVLLALGFVVPPFFFVLVEVVVVPILFFLRVVGKVDFCGIMRIFLSTSARF